MAKKRKRSSTEKTILIIKSALKIFLLAVTVVLLYEGVTKGYELGYNLYYGEAVEAAPGRDIEVTIPEGATGRQVAEILEENGLIRDPFLFQIQEKFFSTRIYSGEFVLNTSMNNRELIRELSAEPGSAEE